ncbi:peroxiredoxin [bacterium]|nr:peroxiredoxin [bacterium]
MLKKGDRAPEFKTQTHQGQTVELSDFRGKKVVLWFYPKADTPGCTAEACGFRDRKSAFEKKNTVLLGVSFDTVEENASFARKFAVDYPLLCDTQRELGIKYGACASEQEAYAQRIAYLIDEAGMIEEVFPKVDARAFPEQLLKQLK